VSDCPPRAGLAKAKAIRPIRRAVSSRTGSRASGALDRTSTHPAACSPAITGTAVTQPDPAGSGAVASSPRSIAAMSSG
jgi:hypothetical protein